MTNGLYNRDAPDRDGRQIIQVVVIASLAVVAAVLYGCGCATPTPTRADRYPVPVMLDPVTEEVPDVKLR